MDQACQGFSKITRAIFLFSIGSFVYCVRKIFRKTNISYPLINTRACAYQGVRNVCFPENFENVLKECSLFMCVGNSVQRCWFKREYGSSSEDISRKYDFLSVLVLITFWHCCFWLNTMCTVYCLQYDWKVMIYHWFNP